MMKEAIVMSQEEKQANWYVIHTYSGYENKLKLKKEKEKQI